MIAFQIFMIIEAGNSTEVEISFVNHILIQFYDVAGDQVWSYDYLFFRFLGLHLKTIAE